MFCADGVWMEPSLGRLIDTLRQKASTFTLALSETETKLPLFSYGLTIDNQSVLPLPSTPSIARGFFNARRCHQVVREIERRSDVVILQIPFAATLALLRPRRPRVYQVIADVLSAAANSQHYYGFKGVIARSGAAFIDTVQHRLIAGTHSRMVAHGKELHERYGIENGRSIVSGTLFDSEILSVARVRREGSPFQILYVGYLRHWKGVDVLVDAYEKLLEDIPGAELKIIGSGDDNTHGIESELRKRIQSINRRGQIELMGRKEFGSELFQSYANADVLVVPSRGGEGTPRVLVEARAFGCPVIGTRVSGIPSSIQDNIDGLLVPPDDVNALKRAILQIARDESLRARLIVAGIQFSRCSTINNMAHQIWEEVESVMLANTSRS